MEISQHFNDTKKMMARSPCQAGFWNNRFKAIRYLSYVILEDPRRTTCVSVFTFWVLHSCPGSLIQPFLIHGTKQSAVSVNFQFTLFSIFSKTSYIHFGEKQISPWKLLFFFCQKCNKVGICLQILFEPVELSNLREGKIWFLQHCSVFESENQLPCPLKAMLKYPLSSRLNKVVFSG